MSKIIFSDLDGTLLTKDKTVSDEDRAAIDLAIAEGNSFVIASGRPFASAIKVSDSLGLNKKGCYLLCYNGGMVYDCYEKKVLMERQLPKGCVEDLFNLANRENLYIHTYEGQTILASFEGDEVRQYSTNNKLEYVAGSGVLKKLTKCPNKTVLIHLTNPEKLHAFVEKYRGWAHGKCEFLFSCREYLETVPVGVNKGAAIEFLADYLGVPLSNTIAVGDERNDISMIQAAGIGVAMANAHEEVKHVAEYITIHDNNHNGMKEVIEKFVLN